MKTIGGAFFFNTINSLKKDIAKLETQITALTQKKAAAEGKLAKLRQMGGKSAKRSKRNNNNTRRRKKSIL